MHGWTTWQCSTTRSKKKGIKRVDSVSAPGIVKQLQEGVPVWAHERMDIAVHHHEAREIWVVGHDDCAGNPVGKKEHRRQVKQATVRVKEAYPNLKVLGFFSQPRRRHPEKGWKLKRVK